MIACSCNVISSQDIDDAVNQAVAGDAMVVLTPLRVFHALGKRPRCGNCMPLIVQLMHEAGQRIRDP